jgi:hypothetical protein
MCAVRENVAREGLMQQEPRWPSVIGTIGIVIGIVLLIDTADDVLTLQWTAEHWRRIFAPEIADVIARAMPSVGMRIVSTVVQVALAALLVVGCLALRRRSRAGVVHCRLWAWLAIAWVVIQLARGAVWLRQFGNDLPSVGAVTPHAYALFAGALAAVILLAFPVFLLVWLSRPAVRAEYERWDS